MRLVGRDEEIRALRQALAASSAGTPTLLVMQGPAGIGKSALLRFLAEAHQGVTCAARGDEVESRLHYGVLRQLIGPPTGDGRAFGDPVSAGAFLLEHIARAQDGGGSVVLVVDDAHWSDEPSLLALLYAVRCLRGDRVLVVVAARTSWSGRIDHSVANTLATVSGARISLRGLAIEGVRDLAREHGRSGLTRTRLEELQVHTAGNPLHLVELLRSMDQRRLASSSPLPAPPSIAETVARRLASVGPEARRLAAAVAVLGGEPSVALVASVAGLDDPHAALDQALAVRLVERLDEQAGHTLRAHPLVSAAVRETMPHSELIGLHRQAARAVESRAARLRHRVACYDGDDRTLISDLAAFAHDLGKQCAWVAAASHLVTAARLETDADKRRDLLLGAAEHSLAAGDAHSAAELLPDECERQDARATYLRGWSELLHGDVQAARRRLDLAWRQSSTTGPAEVAARAAHLLALMCVTGGRGKEGVRWATRALQAASPDACEARAPLAVNLVITGRARRALSLLPPDPLSGGPHGIDVLCAGGVVRMYIDDLDGARAFFRAALDRIRPTDRYHLGVSVRAQLSEVEQRAGRWDESVVQSQLAISALTDADQIWLQAPAFALASTVPGRRGQWDEARRLTDFSRAAAQAVGDPVSLTFSAVAAARLADSRGDPVAVVQATGVLVDMVAAGVDGVDEPGNADWQELRAHALIELGRLDEAVSAIDALREAAAARDHRSGLASAARVCGMLEASRGRIAAAGEQYRAAVAGFRAAGMPFSLARSLMDWGAVLERCGDPVAAALLAEAEATFVTLGAAPWLDRMATPPWRRRLGDAAAEGLRPQELAIALLVARGMTNREIAQEMILSVKTVEFHLAQAFRRLGLRSRGQLAALVADRLTLVAGGPGPAWNAGS